MRTLICCLLLILVLLTTGCKSPSDYQARKYRMALAEYDLKDGKFVNECRSKGGVPEGWVDQYGLLQYEGCSFSCEVKER